MSTSLEFSPRKYPGENSKTIRATASGSKVRPREIELRVGYGEEVKGHSFSALLKCVGTADEDQMTVNRMIND